MKNVFLITTGQSPRDDVREDFRNHFCSDIELFEIGAFDRYSVEDVKEHFSPSENESFLVSRMRNGEMVAFSEEKVFPLVQDAITDACESGADAILVMCTSEFPAMKSSVPVLFPGDLMHCVVPSLAGAMKPAFVFPFESHADVMRKSWEDAGMSVEYICYHPSSGEDETQVIEKIKAMQSDIIVLDCIGFSCEFGDVLMKETGKPVIVPRRVLINTVNILFGY